MDNQLEAYSSVSNEIIDNASHFTEFLSSDTVEPVRKTITIIPNIVKDILDVALENKKLKDEIKEIQEKYKLKNENNLPKDYEKTDEISMDFTEKDGENLEKVLINMNKNKILLIKRI